MMPTLLAAYCLSAAQADYDGKDLVFSGRFQVEHPLGTLKAGKATLSSTRQLWLEKGVTIEAEKAQVTICSQKAFCKTPPTTFFSLLSLQELQFYDDVEIITPWDIRATGGSALYKTGSLTLYPAAPLRHCHLFRDQDRIDAKEVRFEPQCLFLEGDIHFFSPSIQGKESFAIADRVLYYPHEQKLILVSSAPKRVLFWQDGFSLSAPEIHIQRKQQDTIEGKGDVHFAFDLEEQNLIEQLFSKYL